MGFYDSKGYWRNDGDGFYDAKGYFRNPGSGFYDAKGIFRNPGDGFYDAKGNWVNPGGSFYDSKGYRSSAGYTVPVDEGEDIVAVIGFILFILIGILWMATTFFVNWITFHFYSVFIGYIVINVFLALAITKVGKHRRDKFVFAFIGNYVCSLSLIYIMLIYAVPYVTTHGGSFGSFIEFTLVLGLGGGGIAVMQFFNYYHGKAVLEFILGMLFFIIVIMLLKNNAKEMNTIESLAEMYNVKVSVLFKLLFGFAI